MNLPPFLTVALCYLVLIFSAKIVVPLASLGCGVFTLPLALVLKGSASITVPAFVHGMTSTGVTVAFGWLIFHYVPQSGGYDLAPFLVTVAMASVAPWRVSQLIPKGAPIYSADFEATTNNLLTRATVAGMLTGIPIVAVWFAFIGRHLH